jgi:hypothetical protein
MLSVHSGLARRRSGRASGDRHTGRAQSILPEHRHAGTGDWKKIHCRASRSPTTPAQQVQGYLSDISVLLGDSIAPWTSPRRKEIVRNDPANPPLHRRLVRAQQCCRLGQQECVRLCGRRDGRPTVEAAPPMAKTQVTTQVPPGGQFSPAVDKPGPCRHGAGLGQDSWSRQSSFAIGWSLRLDSAAHRVAIRCRSSSDKYRCHARPRAAAAVAEHAARHATGTPSCGCSPPVDTWRPCPTPDSSNFQYSSSAPAVVFVHVVPSPCSLYYGALRDLDGMT